MAEVSRFTRPTDTGSEVLFPKQQVFSITGLNLSIPYLSGKFDWGPIGECTEIFTEDDLVDLYWGGEECYKSAIILFRYYGIPVVLINRLVHYDDITDKSTATSSPATLQINDLNGNVALNITARYHGEAGNDISVETNAYNKISGYLTVATLTHGDSSIELDTVDDIEIGEIIHIDDGSREVWVKVTDIRSNDIHFSPVDLGGIGNTIALGADVESLNSSIDVYYRGELKKQYFPISFEPENVTEYATKTILPNGNIYINVSVAGTIDTDIQYRALASVTNNLSTGSDGDALNDNDFIGSRSNKTGFWALENYGGGKLPVIITMPERVTIAVANAAIAYCDSKSIHFFQGDIPSGYDPEDAENYLNIVGRVNSEFCAFNYPQLEFDDPLNPGVPIQLPNSPFAVGRYAMTDQVKDQGPWQTSAGAIFGILPGVIGLEKVLIQGEMVVPTDDPDTCQDLRAEKINPIVFYKKNSVFMIHGGFTRAKGKRIDCTYINQIRTKQYVGASVDFNIDDVLYANHNSDLEKKMVNVINEFIDEQPNTMLGDDGYEVICDARNNPRKPGQRNKLVSPEDLVVWIDLDLQVPTLRVRYEIRKKVVQS